VSIAAGLIRVTLTGESLGRVLGGGVRALQREGALGQDAADVDQGAAAVAQVRQRHPAAVHGAPVVGLEHSTLILERHLVDAPVD
jgi:hypothetical protein